MHHAATLRIKQTGVFKMMTFMKLNLNQRHKILEIKTKKKKKRKDHTSEKVIKRKNIRNGLIKNKNDVSDIFIFIYF